MKASFLTGIRKFETRDIPEPKMAGETDVLVRIKTVGVCGSDIHYFTTGRIGSQVVEFPFIVGHEVAGVVERTGRKVKRVRAGQKVAIDPAVSCGHCDQCKAGRENTCRKLRFMGAPKQMDGGLRELVVLDERSCYPLPESMTLEQGVLAEPLAIAVYAVEKSKLPAYANIAVLGVGPVGMSVFHVLRTMETGNVYVTDKRDERLAFSRSLNPQWAGNPSHEDIVRMIADFEPLMLDAVFECSGDPAAIAQAVELLKPGGSLALVGIPETDEISFPIHDLRRKEITILNIRRQAHCTQKAIDLLAKREVNMDATVTHRFPLDDTQKAFELVAGYGDGVMKAVVSLEDRS